MNDIDKVIAQTVRRRRRSGKTQADIAKAMGISQSSVSTIETGHTDPLLSTIQRYYRAVTGDTLEIRLVRVIHCPPLPPQPKRVDFCISA